MDRLSPELLILIISDLLPDLSDWPQDSPATRTSTRAAYACVSRRWQYIVESYTFSHIKLHSNQLDFFAELLGNSSRRRAALRKLEYTVELPSYCEMRQVYRETRREQRENNIAFTRAVYGLFTTLNQWNEDPYRPVHLRFWIYSPSDHGHSQRWRENYLGFVPISGSNDDLATALPKLEALEMRQSQPKPKLREIKREHRHALARGLEVLSFSSLRSLCIYYDYLEPFNHSFFPENLHEPTNSSVDSLNIALNILSQTAPLTNLRLTGGWVVSPELFWPAESESTPFWTTLKYFEIEASIVTPDGRYYYTGNPDSVSIDPQDLNYGLAEPSSDEESSSDEEYMGVSITSPERMEHEERLNGEVLQHLWRRELDIGVFDPLILSISRSVVRMPKLQALWMNFGRTCSLGESRVVVIECLGPGEGSKTEVYITKAQNAGENREQEQRIRRWKVWLGHSLSHWLPSMEMQKLWREFVGEGGIIRVEVGAPDPF